MLEFEHEGELEEKKEEQANRHDEKNIDHGHGGGIEHKSNEEGSCEEPHGGPNRDN
jgi:hypothetical protein